MTLPPAPPVVAFLDRKRNGYYPVFDVDGAEIARITVGWTGRKFQAVTGNSEPLCSGAPAQAFSRTFTVVDHSGVPLLSMSSSFWNGKRRTVTLADGRELVLRGEGWPGRDWALVDSSGRTVLNIAATASGWSFHPDAYAVKVGDAGLSLGHVVGVVEINRLLVKAARSSS